MKVTTDQQTTTPMVAWSAVFALSLCASTLVASEWMPVSLLTPIADSLQLTEGQAGQAISVSGLFAILTSLFISASTRGIDRRSVLLWLTGLTVVSGAIVTFAPNYTIFMAARALIGIAIGGFWSMSAATMIRLVADQDVPRALAVLNGGNAFLFGATILGLSSFVILIGALRRKASAIPGCAECVTALSAVKPTSDTGRQTF